MDGPPDVVPFAAEHLDDAGRLLAARHAAHCRAEPLLPERFEDPAAARAEVEALWRTDGASGAAALRGGRVTGFLLGVPRAPATWGPNVWVEPAGQAAEEAEDVRDLYAAAAARWVEEGRTWHYALAPSHDAALADAWFRLSFGQQHALALRELPREAAWPDGVREAEERDLDALVAQAPLLDEHQAASPVFAGPAVAGGDADALRAEILGEIAGPDTALLVAERDGRIAGQLVVAPVELSSTHAGLARAEGAPLLAYAAVEPGLRGSGVGVALTEAAFAWARAHGHEVMATDWRVTNLLASRFWPRRGFRPTFLRLHRLVGR